MKRFTFSRLASIVVPLVAVLAVCVFACSLTGSAEIDIGRALREPDSLDGTILWDLRLMRVLLAAVAGAALSSAGVIFQGVLRNPLADPYILGVASGGAFGAVLAMWLGLDHAWSLPLFAFAGSGLTVTLVYTLSGARARLEPTSLLLVGVVISAFFAAGIRLLHSLADLRTSVDITLWLMGSVRDAPGRAAVLVLAALAAASTAAAYPLMNDLNLISLGEDEAASMGVNVERTKRTSLLLASLVTATAVAYCGPIGFVGLVVPHAVRLVSGPDNRIVLPASFLAGGIFLATCDTFARTVPGVRLPVGVVTAFLGCPVFLLLLKRGLTR